MALRQLFTEIFTPYSVVSSVPGLSEVPENVKQEVSDLLDEHMKDLQLAFADFILRGKCYLWRLNYISVNATNMKEYSHYNQTLDKTEYLISYTELRNIAEQWWANDSKTNVKINIAPQEIWNQLDPDIVKYDEAFFSKFVNPLPIHDTIKKIADAKNTLALTVLPMMSQKALVPTIVVTTKDPLTAEAAKSYLSNYQNMTRTILPGDPDATRIDVIGVGKDIPKDLVMDTLHYYDSSIFMGLGTSLSTVKASGQELTTSRTVDRSYKFV